MADGALSDIKNAPGKFLSSPWMALTIGVLFLVLVLVIEAFKPGLLTGPIRRGLAMVGIRGAAA